MIGLGKKLKYMPSIPETLFAAQTQSSSIHEITEIFPSGGHFEAFFIQFLCDTINGSCGWHASGKTSDTILLEVWNTFQIVGNDSQRIAWCHKESLVTDNHVAIAITIESGAQVVVTIFDSVNEVFSVCEIWIWMETAKVRQWGGVNDIIGSCAQTIQKDLIYVGTGN